MKQENIVLLICAILSFFTVFAFNAVMIVIPTIATEYAMNNIAQNWVTIIFLLIVAIMSVPAGQISGKYGLKKVTIISLILFIVVSVVNVFAPNTEIFLICRLILGIAISFINSKDIATYLKKINYNFNTLETSWLIYQSSNHTLQEKKTAWQSVSRQSARLILFVPITFATQELISHSMPDVTLIKITATAK